jgi:hypothetical protein
VLVPGPVMRPALPATIRRTPKPKDTHFPGTMIDMGTIIGRRRDAKNQRMPFRLNFFLRNALDRAQRAGARVFMDIRRVGDVGRILT